MPIPRLLRKLSKYKLNASHNKITVIMSNKNTSVAGAICMYTVPRNPKGLPGNCRLKVLNKIAEKLNNMRIFEYSHIEGDTYKKLSNMIEYLNKDSQRYRRKLFMMDGIEFIKYAMDTRDKEIYDFIIRIYSLNDLIMSVKIAISDAETDFQSELF